jgi:hypothetical protein
VKSCCAFYHSVVPGGIRICVRRDKQDSAAHFDYAFNNSEEIVPGHSGQNVLSDDDIRTQPLSNKIKDLLATGKTSDIAATMHGKCAAQEHKHMQRIMNDPDGVALHLTLLSRLSGKTIQPAIAID